MALQNAAELSAVLGRPDRLGRVYARHAYGMRVWVDRFSARIAATPSPEDKALVAAVVAANARHMLLFRERARAHGVDPDAYLCPAEGEVIYARLGELRRVDELIGYALGSLDHFAELLGVYRAAAGGADAEAIDAVRADVDRDRVALRARVGSRGRRLAAEAHERYRLRELVEIPLYAHAG
jgi:hypothetical protein